jgi:hypothetical protein
MSYSPRDLCTPSQASGGPRRWALKLLAGSVLGVGILTSGRRAAAAGDGDQFEQ